MMRATSKQTAQEPQRAFLLVAVLLAFGAGLSACGKGPTPVAEQDARDAEAVQPANGDQPAVGEVGSGVEPAAPAAPDGEVAIKVNNHVVTFEEFEQDLQEQTGRLEQQLGDMEQSPEMKQRFAMIRDQMKQQLVDQTITRLLLEDYIAGSEMEVSEEEVEREWSEVTAQFPDEQALEQTLEREGMTIAEAREQIAQRVKLDKLMAQELGEAEVTDAEAQAFYDMQPEEFAQPMQVRARHILLSDGDGAKEAIEALHKRIEEGEDFAALASEHSECPSSEQGGDLGFFGEGQMVEPFSRQAFAMKPGEVSEPVQTQFGYHIIKVEERREAKQAEFADVESAIKEHLGRQRVQVQQDEFLDRLKEEAEIIVNVDLPASQPSPFSQPAELEP